MSCYNGIIRTCLFSQDCNDILLSLWIFSCTLQHTGLIMNVSEKQNMKLLPMHFTALEDKTVLLERQYETVLENDSSSIQLHPLETTK